MKKSYNPLRGFRYFTYLESTIFKIINEKLFQLLDNNNIQLVHLPILAKTEIFNSLGENSDIVNKELYAFQQKDGENVCLVPEYTRILVEQLGYNNIKKGKFAYLGPCFRYERPQFGRYRSFYQMGIEIIGESSYMADMELIVFLEKFFRSLLLNKYTLHINSIGTIEDRKIYEAKLEEYFKPLLPYLSETSQLKYERKAFLRMLDSKDEKDLVYIKNAPKIYDFLNEDSFYKYHVIIKCLNYLHIDYVENRFLVRGLDYYNDFVFEYTHEDLGAQSSFCGGGRYDGLLPKILKNNIPAVGFGIGIDRLIHILEKNQNFVNKYLNCKKIIYILPIEEPEYLACFKIKMMIDRLNIYKVEVVYEKKLSKRLEEANKKKIPIVIMFGETELNKDEVILKKMHENITLNIKINKLVEYLSSLEE